MLSNAGARSTEAVEFFSVLKSPELLQTTEALLPEHRERLSRPTVALSMFMRQVLEADGACQKAIKGWPTLDAVVGQHSGKGSGEFALVPGLLAGFRPGDVMLADALYCNCFPLTTPMAAGVDVLFEQNGSRITDFRRGQSLGTREHCVRWPKPAEPGPVHVSRAMQARPSARRHRAANAKMKAQALPLVEGAPRPGPPTRPEAWSRA